jgi:hypothetical protein
MRQMRGSTSHFITLGTRGTCSLGRCRLRVSSRFYSGFKSPIASVSNWRLQLPSTTSFTSNPSKHLRSPPHTPEAEFESIEEAHAYIQDVGVYEAIYFEAVAFAIRATVPSFGLEMDTGMGLSDELPFASDVRQPHLFIIPTSQHYRVGAALALADVATPGLCPPELYRAEGDRRFCEQKPNLEF